MEYRKSKSYLYLSTRLLCQEISSCLLRKASEISLKLNESDQSNGLFALRVRVFEAQIEGFQENPIRPVWVGSRRSVIADIHPCDRPLSVRSGHLVLPYIYSDPKFSLQPPSISGNRRTNILIPGSRKSQRGGELKCPPNVVGWSRSIARSSGFYAAR